MLHPVLSPDQGITVPITLGSHNRAQGPKISVDEPHRPAIQSDQLLTLPAKGFHHSAYWGMVGNKGICYVGIIWGLYLYSLATTSEILCFQGAFRDWTLRNHFACSLQVATRMTRNECLLSLHATAGHCGPHGNCTLVACQLRDTVVFGNASRLAQACTHESGTLNP